MSNLSAASSLRTGALPSVLEQQLEAFTKAELPSLSWFANY
jgi:hypothetical protein